MREITKRTASFSVGIAVFALIGAGCHHATNAGQATSSATSSASSTSSPVAMAPATTTAAPSSTQIAGKNGTEYTVEGPILARWETLNDAQKTDLGAPYDNQKSTGDNSGVYQQFDGGVLIYRNGGPVYFVWGKIRDAWNDNQGSQGKLGYPTADEVKEPDGSFKSTFDHGTITWKPGDAQATITMS
jgi:uncharacterized protein with LGFP repeats